MKERNCTIRRGVLNLSNLCLIFPCNFVPSSHAINENPSYLFSDNFNVFHKNPRCD
jgi:hypothetical protein